MDNNQQNINPQLEPQNQNVPSNQPSPSMPSFQNNNNNISNVAYTDNINPQSMENSIQSRPQSHNNFINPEPNAQIQNQNTEINEMLNMNTDNRFLSQNEFNETSLNELNVEGGYNNIERTDYSQEPQVRANIDGQKKNTITITGEMKTFIIIALVLLIFIFAMPYIFDLIREIKY